MTKEKILDATLHLIKSEGFDSVTIRKIAGEAGTNVALINYYFGSKEKLMHEAMKMILETFRSAFDIFDVVEYPPIERLRQFVLTYASFLKDYPDLLKRILGHDPLFESVAEYVHFMKQQGFEKVSAVMIEVTGVTDRKTVLLMTQHMFAAIMSPFTKVNPVTKCQPSNSIQSSLFDIPFSIEESIDLFFEHYFHKYSVKI
ncbi:TetR/AcrR family transcriptional regulator [Paenibacillus sp. FSL R10-2734]|uniref:TetR/AcrR family transcriptional regulator n=1 Tax=Paenibacillus sp. FSL R10-2734 TaxID=2954691 RepID=UPI0030DC8650